MPGYLLDQSATVLCMHGGQAQGTVPNPRVKISGQPTMQQPNPWTDRRLSIFDDCRADAVCHGAMDYCCDPREVRRHAAAATGQPGGLRA